MEEQVNRLVEKTWKKYQETPLSQRLLIGICGIPGSGKTTLAAHLTTRLNAIHHELSPGVATQIASFIPMDGYHLTRTQLSALPDPAQAHLRRGAAFTFDGPAFLTLVRRLRAPLAPETKTIWAPSFDHATKDPVADDIGVPATARVVVLEGNYLGLNRAPWHEAGALMDELWFVEVDFDVATRRLVERHVATGVARNEAEAERRVRENDLRNAREVVQGLVAGVKEVVVSVEDEGWRGEGVEEAGGGREG
ncbi:MAG: hypothetical protein M1816_007468 [Peltula sp. TS41687]|nr:MAG: hypothetical protein M1816_007468 [Peltula sp. TS41687]